MKPIYIHPSINVPAPAARLLHEWSRDDVRNATVAGTYPIVDWEDYNGI
jgi:hypothetical protein